MKEPLLINVYSSYVGFNQDSVLLFFKKDSFIERFSIENYFNIFFEPGIKIPGILFIHALAPDFRINLPSITSMALI